MPAQRVKIQAGDRAALLDFLRLLAPPRRDPERDHGEADDALLEFIGDAEIAAAYNAIEKWYA